MAKLNLRRIIFLISALAFFGYALMIFICWFFQSSHVYFPVPPSRIPFDIHVSSGAQMSSDAHVSPHRPGAVDRGGWAIIRDPHRALVIFGDGSQALEPWIWGNGLSGCTSRTLILVPYRGFEGNPGTPSEKALEEDARATLAWAQQRFSSVAILGFGLGGALAIDAASSSSTPPDTLLLVSPFDSLTRVIADIAPLTWPSLWLRDRYDSTTAATRLTMPVWVYRASNDGFIRPERSRALIQAFQSTHVNDFVVEGGHLSSQTSPQVCVWLKKALGENVSRK